MNAINPTIRNSSGRTRPTRKSPQGLRARSLGRTSLPMRPTVSEDRGASWKGPGISTLQPSQGQNDCIRRGSKLRQETVFNQLAVLGAERTRRDGAAFRRSQPSELTHRVRVREPSGHSWARRGPFGASPCLRKPWHHPPATAPSLTVLPETSLHAQSGQIHRQLPLIKPANGIPDISREEPQGISVHAENQLTRVDTIPVFTAHREQRGVFSERSGRTPTGEHSQRLSGAWCHCPVAVLRLRVPLRTLIRQTTREAQDHGPYPSHAHVPPVV